MKIKNYKFVRTTLLDYKYASRIINEAFINETKQAIDRLNEYPRINPLTIDDKCKKLNFSIYKKKYINNLKLIKINTEKICGSSIMGACLEYNNRQLFRDFKKIKYLKDQKTKNNTYKSLTSYSNRVSYNSLYGGLMGFYTLVEPKQSTRILPNKIELSLYFEKNRFLATAIHNLSKNICYNPTVLENNGLVYLKYENGKEQIVKINNPLILSIFRGIKNKKFYINNNFDYKTRAYQKFNIKKMVELGLIRFNSKENFDFCFKKKGHLKFKKIRLDRGIKLDNNNVYDVINASTFRINENIYSDFEKAAYIYLDLLHNQLQGIHAEKVYLGNIIKKYLIKIKKSKCLLLNFIIDYNSEILELRKRREDLHASFYKKIFFNIKSDRITEDIKFDGWKIENNDIRKNLELYFSTCKIDKKRHILIENISPIGVFSSRFDYLTDYRIVSEYNDPLEPIEVVFTPSNYKLFHAFRRKKYTKYCLNINNYIKYSKRNILNINDIYIALNETGLPVLYSPKLNKYFDPVIHSTLPAEQSIITIFLKMISKGQEEIYSLPKLLPGKVNNSDYMPRIIINNLVVSKRIWRIYIEEVNIIKCSMPKYNEYLYLIRLFKTKKIPRFVNIFSSQDGIPRPVDTYNPLSLLAFKKYNNEKFIYIEEMLPSPEHVDFFDEQIGHFNQYYYNFSIS